MGEAMQQIDEFRSPAKPLFLERKARFGSRADRPLDGLTVLLVEDSRFASEAVRLLCLRSGARLRRADCLRSAARHLQVYRPGAVIVDMGLPDGDGGQLIARIDAMLPRVPILLGLSGDPTRRDEALAAGADGFITKPILGVDAFQQAIISAAPPHMRPHQLRVIGNETVNPDHAALRDDLRQIADLLVPDASPETLVYAAQFLSGLGRAAGEPVLAKAAIDLEANKNEDVITRVRALVEQRANNGLPA